MRRSLVVVAVLLIVVLVAAAVLRQTPNYVMAVAIRVSSDEQGSSDVYSVRRWFRDARTRGAVEVASVDLSPWAGQLVRLDVRGRVEHRDAPLKPAGRVALRGHLSEPHVSAPLEFVGWRNYGSLPFHVSDLGSPTLVLPGDADPQYVYAEDDRLWHVFRAPEQGVVRIDLRPVLLKDLPQEIVPTSHSMQTLQTSTPRATHEGRHHPDVFVYLIDALRADHLSCYGYERPTSPNIDSFAESAILYEQYHTAVTWTRPSVATLFTGLYPCVHGVVHEGGDSLAEWPVLLPELLRDAGYATYCISTNPNVSEEFGFDRGFDELAFGNYASPEWVNEVASDLLADVPADRPVFMYLHTMEPHAPYEPEEDSFRLFDRGFMDFDNAAHWEIIHEVEPIHPELTAENVGHLLDLYDGEIYDNDRGFADFLRLLKQSGRYEDALIILVADHGESFTDHGTLEHGLTLNQEEMHVPLVIRPPGGVFPGVQVGERTSSVDLYPTVLTATGAPIPRSYSIPGEDLLALARRSASARPRRVYAELSMLDSNELDLVTVIDEDGFKRVADLSVIPGGAAAAECLGLWDTATDPEEWEDLSASLPVRAAYGDQLIAMWLLSQSSPAEGGHGGAARAAMTDELREKLRDLGYLH